MKENNIKKFNEFDIELKAKKSEIHQINNMIKQTKKELGQNLIKIKDDSLYLYKYEHLFKNNNIDENYIFSQLRKDLNDYPIYIYHQNEKLNIVIVTLNKLYNKKTNFTFEPDWNKIYSELRSKINKKFRPNITFITASQGRLEEHDRTIFTNYKTFASGYIYNYFDNKGNKITNGRYLHAYS